MKKLFKRLRRMFSKKADIVVYRNGKVYRFRTFEEAYPYMINS